MMKTNKFKLVVRAILVVFAIGTIVYLTGCGDSAGNSSLSSGDASYQFSFEDKDGKMVSMADLKGKVVLIDVWATWCRPCIAEVPHLKKLEAEMKGKDLAIVSISIDNEKAKEKWRTMIEEEELAGIHLYANGGEEFMSHYEIKGIPRFMVFDKEGKVVNIRAPRPSQPHLKILLEEILTKK